MSSLQRIVAIAVLAIACSAPSLAEDVWVIRFDGAGPVKIGMRLPELNTLLHEKFVMPANKEDQGCFYSTPGKHPHIAFMIEEGRLVRIDVNGPGVRTAERIQVGDSEAHAFRVYGPKMKVEPHAYTGPEGSLLDDTVQQRSLRHQI